ncbi:hypothetical protein [Mangrovimonas spongiae]|uniref:Uncharacterized protein n=1 Tax=Mangrovimonas spongiae TaxID=2494697 RepID=A0A428JYE5_9FLAO|nr:hypothetical protein [Mangrovimonas spongiae]RSK39157.1 hypothetical protein EJA19_09450 [Mangrovimonas spongiae]
MKNSLIITGQITALLSFIIGTSLFSIQLYFGMFAIPVLLIVGFLLTAFIANLVILSVIVGASILNKIDRNEGLKTCLIMLLNIPIALLYYYLTITFSRNSFLF